MLMLPAIDLQRGRHHRHSSPGAGQPLYLVNANGERSIGLKRFRHDPDRQRTDHPQRDGESLTVTARGASSTTAAARRRRHRLRGHLRRLRHARRTIERIEWERSQAPHPESFKAVLFDPGRATPADRADTRQTGP